MWNTDFVLLLRVGRFLPLTGRVKGRVVEEIFRNQLKPSPEYGDRVSVFVP